VTHHAARFSSIAHLDSSHVNPCFHYNHFYDDYIHKHINPLQRTMSPMMMKPFLAKIAVLLLLSLSSVVCVSATTMLATTTTEIDDKDMNVLPQEYHGGVRRQPRDGEQDEPPQDGVLVAGGEVEADFQKDKTTARPTAHPTALPTARPTAIPTVLPTALPTALPTGRPSTARPSTFSPTTFCPAMSPPITPVPGGPAGAYTQSTTGCGFYKSLDGCSGATPVTFTATNAINAAANDEGAAVITLPRPLNLYGNTTITSIVLSTNGIIRFDGIFDEGGFVPQPITTTGSGGAAIPRIAFAQEDLIALVVNTLDTGRSFIISFDSAHFFSNAAKIVQVQIELFYASGDFDIRWGSINAVNDVIACGIEDQTRSPPFALRCAIGTPNLFNSRGITFGSTAAEMPQNQCLAFTVTDATLAPTGAPTLATPGGFCSFTRTTGIAGLPVSSTVPLTFAGIPNAAGAAVTIQGDVNGDFGASSERTTYFDENGNPILQPGAIGTDCIPDSDSTTVTAAVFNGWNVNSVVTFNVAISADVAPSSCPLNEVGVTLTYAC
jgi:hypothetical protein